MVYHTKAAEICPDHSGRISGLQELYRQEHSSRSYQESQRQIQYAEELM